MKPMKSTKQANQTKAKGPARGSLEAHAAACVSGRSLFVRWYRHVPGLASREENQVVAARLVSEWRAKGYKVKTARGMSEALELVCAGVAVIVCGEPGASRPQRVRVLALSERQAFASG